MWEEISELNYPETQEERDRTLISYVIHGKRVYLSYNECNIGWGTLMKDSDLDTRIFKVPEL